MINKIFYWFTQTTEDEKKTFVCFRLCLIFFFFYITKIWLHAYIHFCLFFFPTDSSKLLSFSPLSAPFFLSLPSRHLSFFLSLSRYFSSFFPSLGTLPHSRALIGTFPLSPPLNSFSSFFPLCAPSLHPSSRYLPAFSSLFFSPKLFPCHTNIAFTRFRYLKWLSK